ncbi:hypothetical protein P4O66_001558 [Electrophorus voltai]|uniref:DNA-directed DNA polymerase n=1 Tax=Electrophorus voltai TaxID=2609070 RepID=A0AAD9DW75_9TELE|nr:hypothetical protein P4O66_001558 [Electrophorus voltai]
MITFILMTMKSQVSTRDVARPDPVPVPCVRDTARPDPGPVPRVRDTAHPDPDPVPRVRDAARPDPGPVPRVRDAARLEPGPVPGVRDVTHPEPVPVRSIVDVARPVTRSAPVAAPPDPLPPLMAAAAPLDPPVPVPGVEETTPQVPVPRARPVALVTPRSSPVSSTASAPGFLPVFPWPVSRFPYASCFSIVACSNGPIFAFSIALILHVPQLNLALLRTCLRLLTTQHYTQTFGDVHQNSFNKIQMLLCIHKLSLTIMWEHEWNDMKKNDEDVKRFLKTFDIPERLNPWYTLLTVHPNALQLYYTAQPGERIDYYDFTSLYPYMNKVEMYPIGQPVILYRDFGLLENNFGIIKNLR